MYEYDGEFNAGFRRFGCVGGSLVFRFTFRLGILERIFPFYAQSILGQSWVLGVIVLVGLFVGSTWVICCSLSSICIWNFIPSGNIEQL